MKRASRLGMLVGAVAVASLLVGYTTETVQSGGRIAGTVRLSGTAPVIPAHAVEDASQRAVCGATVEDDSVVVGAGGAIANAVVSIEGIERGAAARPTSITLDQRGCRFVPRVQAAARGSQLTVISSDPTLHNVHTRIGPRTLFNVAMPTKGMRVQRRLAQPGLVTSNCDAGHTWMRGYVHVFEHPYFAVTGPDGRFELTDVPAGTHRLRVWHERFGEQTGSVRVDAAGAAVWDVTLRAR